MQRYREYFMG